MFYRKKPVIVEAFFFGLHVYPLWFKQALKDGAVKYIENEENMPCDVEIKTLEGTHLARQQRDYIIKGVKGEIYPCKADIFEMTYELVEQKYEVRWCLKTN